MMWRLVVPHRRGKQFARTRPLNEEKLRGPFEVSTVDSPPSVAEGSVTRPESLLRTSELTKSFGGVVAVDGVSFDIGRGESVGLVGPNGAGKTTLFNCIGGQLNHEAGTIEFKGDTIDSLPNFRRARMGIGRTYQRIEVFPDLTVYQHLLVAERARRGDGRVWKDVLRKSAPCPDELEAVDEVLDLVDLRPQRDTPVSALGLGMCRLVELARALVGRPDLLMADEPSSGLDIHETRELALVLRTLQQEKGMAVLLVEHDLGMVGEVVDRAVVMDLGRVIASGPFDQVMAEPEVRRAYLGVSA
jgi:branched-chain amino acid transport system ATP-binding protein